MHLGWSMTVTSLPSPHFKSQTNKDSKEKFLVSLSKQINRKKIPEAEILFIFSILKILMPNSYTDEEKQGVQRLCSYGIVAGVKQVSVLYELQF